jgi:hypothetical protein
MRMGTVMLRKTSPLTPLPRGRWKMFSFSRTFWLISLLICLGSSGNVFAKVYTTRPSGSADLDQPGTYFAQKIYGGKFKINGLPADLTVLAGTKSPRETYAILQKGNQDFVKARESTNAIVGSWKIGNVQRRFLIFSVGSTQKSLVFILNGDQQLYQPNPEIPWPDHLPVLDPSQRPQLVVEHLDNDFVFGCVQISHPSVERALDFCRERMRDAGWETEPLTDKIAEQLADTSFSVLNKKGKVCWLSASKGARPGEVLVTILCKKSTNL